MCGAALSLDETERERNKNQPVSFVKGYFFTLFNDSARLCAMRFFGQRSGDHVVRQWHGRRRELRNPPRSPMFAVSLVMQTRIVVFRVALA